MSFLENAVYINLFTIVALVAVSFVLGEYVAKAVRMKDYAWKFSVILLALLASITVLWRGWPPKLGVDLGGGVILVYQVDPANTRADFDMQKLVTAISERVNPGGQREITVRPLGTDKIQITMPQVGEEESRRIKAIISRAGTLEFRIVANTRDHRSLIDRALSEPEHRILLDSSGETLAWWVPVKNEEARGFLRDNEIGKRAVKNGAVVPVGTEGSRLEVLVVMDPYNVKGERLRAATPQIDQSGRPSVGFNFDSQGGALFGKLTGANLPQDDFKRRLAIILDGELYSAPSINSTIFDRGEITGSFSQDEVNDLVKVLNAGSLPAALKKDPVRDLTTGATLGGDTIRKSAHAMIIASILVPLFMFWYYRFAGMVANVALVLNMLMLVAIMILIKAPFTLPALAGLALTVGMAVDNNVLIYERLREELAHGAALRMAIRNAFHRAGVVIIDANITHLIAASVLWAVGTEQVKGFAVTFWLGAVLSIWATMFVARVMFEVAERRQWLTRVKMMHIIGHTKIDFMHWFSACATFSVVITVLGLAVAVYRGKGLFDIDFTGGVSVQAQFNAPQDIAVIRQKVAHLPDVAVSSVHLQDEPEGQRFIIDTSELDLKTVKDELQRIFGTALVSNSMEFGKPEVISATAAPGAKSGGETSPGEKLPAKPAPRKSDKETPSVGTPTEKPAAKPAEKPATKPEEKPATKPEEKPGDKPEAKPPEKVEEKPATTVEEKPAAKPEEKPADKPEEKPADKPETKPATKPEEKPATKPEEKPADTPDAKPADKVEEKPADKPESKPADKDARSGDPERRGVVAFSLAQAFTPGGRDRANVSPLSPAVNGRAREKECPRQGDLPPDTMLAMAGPAPLLVAFAEKTDAPAPAAAAAKEPDAKEKPGEKTETAAKAKATPKTEPAEKKPATSEKAPPVKPAPQKPLSRPAEAEIAPPASPFVGGTHVDLSFTYKVDYLSAQDMVIQALAANKLPAETPFELSNAAYTAGDSTPYKVWTLKIKLPPEQTRPVLTHIEQQVAHTPYFPDVDNIGTAVARDTQFYAVIALVSSWALIILYLWVRFQAVGFGVAAVVALIHDVLVMLGAIAFSYYVPTWLGVATMIDPFKINLPIVAAFMTIIGYSVNDTIVVFDRIREIRGKDPRITREMVNDATNQTLSRTLLTSFTVLLVVVILYLFGGQAVHGFAFALIIGVLTGTYSSIYVAAPLLLWLVHPKEMRRRSLSGEP